MSGMLGGEYRDETRIVHMLQALERIEQETGETSRDKLFFNDRLTLKFSASPREISARRGEFALRQLLFLG